MKFLILLLSLTSFKALACVEVMENRRVNDMTYKAYADDGRDKCLRLPYVQKNFNVQNLFFGSDKIGFLSLNHQKTNLETKKLSSRVLQTNLRTGKILRTYSLEGSLSRGYLGHVKSVALFDNETKFAVPSGKSICIFDRKNASIDKSGVYHSKLLSCQEQNLSSDGAISNFKMSKNHNNENYLWTVFKGKQGNMIYGFKVNKGRILKANSYKFDLPISVSNVSQFAVTHSKGNYSFLISPDKGGLAYQVDYSKGEGSNYKLASVNKFGQGRLPAANGSSAKALPSLFKTYELLDVKEVYAQSKAKIYNLTSLVE
jgi:hypothetical protein